MKTPIIIALAALVTAPVSGQTPPAVPKADFSERLERADYLQFTAKDLDAAAKEYATLLAANPSGEIALRARLQLAGLHLARGEKSAAADALREISRVLEAAVPGGAAGGGTPGDELAAFRELLGQIEKGALKGVDQKQLLEAAMKGIAGSLGQHAEYLDPSAMTSVMQAELVGIGTALKKSPDGPVVIEAVAGSPAEEAGVQPGWTIVEIDGKPGLGAGDKLQEAVSAIRGKAGTGVQVKFRLPDGSDRSVQFTRRKVELKETGITSHRVQADGSPNWTTEEGILTVHVPSFYQSETASVAADLRKVIESQSPKAILLDLRHNGGGSMEMALEMADMFLKEGVIVRLRNKDGSEDKSASPGNEVADVPLVLLVNEQTASAAEIVTSALQDHRRATIIGHRTYGRGTVRQLLPAPAGGSVLVPIAEFLRSTGARIERDPQAKETDTWGVTPDIIIPPQTAPAPAEQTAPAPPPAGLHTAADKREAALKDDVQYQAGLTHLRERLAKK